MLNDNEHGLILRGFGTTQLSSKKDSRSMGVRICGFTFARPVTPQELLMDVSMAAFL